MYPYPYAGLEPLHGMRYAAIIAAALVRLKHVEFLPILTCPQCLRREKSIMKLMLRHSLPAVVAMVAIALSGCLRPAPDSQSREIVVPDYTRGDKPPDSNVMYHLHISTVRGQVYMVDDSCKDSRQIHVSKVQDGSHWADFLRVGDVILGINGKNFDSNAIVMFRNAVKEAKLPGADGVLRVVRWRDGSKKNIKVDVLAPVPDLVAGDSRDSMHDWNLGPTGARGWIFGRNLETAEARQILVTEVEGNSPAHGILQPGDIILGTGDRIFEADPRKSFARALTLAETEQGKGLLNLVIWREGDRKEVEIRIPAIGTYSDTAPFDCPKTARILDAACTHIAKNGLKMGIVGDINSLALLSTGRDEYKDLVQEYALKRVESVQDKELNTQGLVAWHWGYANLFLTEYFLATGDKRVLPAIEKYASTIARGQSGVGTWGHGMAWPESNNGELHGRLGGYGAVNQAGLVCFLSLVLADKCGIRNNEIDDAVERGTRFFSFYINKGAIPYGDHKPGWESHDNNGACSIASVLFNLMGNKDGATFFSKMVVASYSIREAGHTGNFWSFLWGPMGAAPAGPDAAAAFMKELRWFHDLERRWDGGFVYQGAPGGAGAEHKYGGWDCTGARVLACALPLRKLYITGKDKSVADQLKGKELAEVVRAGQGIRWMIKDRRYFDTDPEQIFELLESWSPVVRFRAARALAATDGKHVPKLLGMLAREDINARYGACRALEELKEKAAPATDMLLSALSSEDTWLRIRASHALTAIGDRDEKIVSTLLRKAVEQDPNDPREFFQRYLCLGLFGSGMYGVPKGLLRDDLSGVDRDLFYPAVKHLFLNDDGHARNHLGRMLRNLTFDELEPLWPTILRAVTEGAPSGMMYESGVRNTCMNLLSRYHVKEGLPAILEYTANQNAWGTGKRLPIIMKALRSYEASAKPILPELERIKNRRETRSKAQVQQVEMIKETMDYIAASKNEVKLISVLNP